MNAPPTPPTAEEIAALETLLRHADIAGLDQVDHAAMRMNHCIEVGNILADWKRRIPSGHWERWLDDHICARNSFSLRTAQRWMKLAAKVKAGLDLTKGRGLRQAYILADILPDTSAERDDHGSTGKPTFVMQTVRFAALCRSQDVASFTPPEVATLRVAFKAVAAFMEELPHA